MQRKPVPQKYYRFCLIWQKKIPRNPDYTTQPRSSGKTPALVTVVRQLRALPHI